MRFGQRGTGNSGTNASLKKAEAKNRSLANVPLHIPKTLAPPGEMPQIRIYLCIYGPLHIPQIRVRVQVRLPGETNLPLREPHELPAPTVLNEKCCYLARHFGRPPSAQLASGSSGHAFAQLQSRSSPAGGRSPTPWFLPRSRRKVGRCETIAEEGGGLTYARVSGRPSVSSRGLNRSRNQNQSWITCTGNKDLRGGTHATYALRPTPRWPFFCFISVAFAVPASTFTYTSRAADWTHSDARRTPKQPAVPEAVVRRAAAASAQ